MFDKAKPARDAFTFSLGGMAAINSYAIAPIIANDRINKAWDRRFSGPEGVEESPEGQLQLAFGTEL